MITIIGLSAKPISALIRPLDHQVSLLTSIEKQAPLVVVPHRDPWHRSYRIGTETENFAL